MFIIGELWRWIKTVSLEILFPRSARERVLLALQAHDLRALLGRGVREEYGVKYLFDYQHNTIRELVWLLKYKGEQKTASLFAEILYEQLLFEFEDAFDIHGEKKPLLVPIPIGKNRRRERGFNQCEVLLREVIKFDEGRSFVYAPHALKKFKETEHQAKAPNKRVRLLNLKGSFVAEPNTVRGQTVILIDDVLTTGSTMAEGKRALREAGARRVFPIALTH